MSKGILTQEPSPVDDLFLEATKNDLRNSAYEVRRKSWVKTRTEKEIKKKGLNKDESTQLSLLYEDSFVSNLRNLPNDFARSALFTARNNRSPRTTFKREVLFHYNKDITFVYTGVELRADTDELLFMQLIHYASKVPLGQSFPVKISELLRDLCWPDNKQSYERVRDCITRMKATELLVKNDKAYGISGAFSLIGKYKVTNGSDGNPTAYLFSLDPEIILFFAGGTYTSYNWDVYKKYSPVARRLSDYMRGHKRPYPLAPETFMKMCGCNSRKSDWKITVTNACREILDGGCVKKIGFDSDGKIIAVR